MAFPDTAYGQREKKTGREGRQGGIPELTRNRKETTPRRYPRGERKGQFSRSRPLLLFSSPFLPRSLRSLPPLTSRSGRGFGLPLESEQREDRCDRVAAFYTKEVSVAFRVLPFDLNPTAGELHGTVGVDPGGFGTKVPTQSATPNQQSGMSRVVAGVPNSGQVAELRNAHRLSNGQLQMLWAALFRRAIPLARHCSFLHHLHVTLLSVKKIVI